MKKAFTLIELLVVAMIVFILFMIALPRLGHAMAQMPTQSASGVGIAHVSVATGTDGLTVEQRNVANRLKMDNLPGSIKHLYIISAYSGQVLIYSTVKGKVTSSGKRLTPTSLAGRSSTSNGYDAMTVTIGNTDYNTTEVLQDDGTYGTSVDYIYWWDIRGVYHQQYVTGGMIVHISDQPISVKSVVINMEESTTTDKL